MIVLQICWVHLIFFNDKHNWDSLRCFAHTLQLSLIPELNVATIDRLISAARKLVGHFKHSVLATEELMKREAQMDIPRRKVIQDCPTR